MLHIQVFHCNPLQENAYLLWDDTREGVVVDPGFDGDAELSRFRTFLKENDIRLIEIWLTHGHFDHILGVTALVRENPVPVRLHPADRPQLERARLMAAAFGIDFPKESFETVDLADGEELRVGTMVFRVITTPGHTPGGVSFYSAQERILLTGDTLFAGSIGRTDLPGGEYDDLIVSIMDKLMGLDGDVEILPGHGGVSDIATERTHNPFLQPFNEPDDPDLSVEI